MLAHVGYVGKVAGNGIDFEEVRVFVKLTGWRVLVQIVAAVLSLVVGRPYHGFDLW